MLESFIYRNHMGEELHFGSDGLYVNTNELHSYSWDVKSRNDRIYSFRKGITEKKIPIIIACDTEEEGIKKRNQIYEVCEKDVISGKYGTINIGQYYLKCYVKESSKTVYLTNKKHMEATLIATTDYPYWIKDSKYRFGYGSNIGMVGEGEYLDFPYDIPYDYAFPLINNTIRNTGIISANFKIVIYGQCENPSVIIGNHAYTVNLAIGNNEYLTIDSTTKKIFVTTEDGSTVNCFNKRGKTDYIFEKIKSGTNFVELVNCYRADVTLYDERSEPKWT